MLQREILDERRFQPRYSPQNVGVNSLGGFGLHPRLAGSDAIPAFGDVPVHIDERASRRDSDVAALLMKPQTSNILAVRLNTRSRASGLRDRELEWRRTNVATLRQYENEWVVLEVENIVAHGADPAHVIQEAKRRGVLKPYIFFVERNAESIVRIGL
jgi:hypothetical protein